MSQTTKSASEKIAKRQESRYESGAASVPVEFEFIPEFLEILFF